MKEHYCLLPFYLSLWIFCTYSLFLYCIIFLYQKSFKFGLTASVNFNYRHWVIWLIVHHQFGIPNVPFASIKIGTAELFLLHYVWCFFWKDLPFIFIVFVIDVHIFLASRLNFYIVCYVPNAAYSFMFARVCFWTHLSHKFTKERERESSAALTIRQMR